MRILVDTNVLLRASDSTNLDSRKAFDRLASLFRGGNTPCLTAQNLYEFWVACTRPRDANGMGMSTTEAATRLAYLRESFHVLEDSPQILPLWEGLVVRYDVQGKSAHDARLVAAMMAHDVKHLVTFNARHFARYDGITVLSPTDSAWVL